MKRILLSGGTGLLGTELLNIAPSINAPSHQEMDIAKCTSIEAAIGKYDPEIFLHCAGLVGTRECSQDLMSCMNINVHGTLNVISNCLRHDIRLVYISTEYAFDGKRGNYSEEDLVNPLSDYAKSKVAGEMMVRCYIESLIIRTTFCSPVKWKFEGAFTDQFTSRDTVDVIGRDILRAALSELTGVIHIGTERKSQFDLARRIDPYIKPLSISQVDLPLPRDTSLNCSRWKDYNRSPPQALGATH
ncbi:MAG: dTDP-4-rhamnose reductase [Rhodospirillaceae bacterium]|jgi:dTDP-4-dehydrorhamnose reductase|nr:dTDP-4-rhamnose reductase [Rhodospirillaceae bacterium]|tara:strand:- start:346 stop:1080 length:735 start_codon:yes stop_codon:yes gene_type:complete